MKERNRRSREDFMLLHTMSNTQVEGRITAEHTAYEHIMEDFERLEKECRANHEPLPKIEVLLQRLSNCEGYVREAENLIHGYEKPTYGASRVQIKDGTLMPSSRMLKLFRKDEKKFDAIFDEDEEELEL